MSYIMCSNFGVVKQYAYSLWYYVICIILTAFSVFSQLTSKGLVSQIPHRSVPPSICIARRRAPSQKVSQLDSATILCSMNGRWLKLLQQTAICDCYGDSTVSSDTSPFTKCRPLTSSYSSLFPLSM